MAMNIINITNKQYKIYFLIFLLSVVTFFALAMLDEKLQIALTIVAAFIYDWVFEKILYKDKIVLNFYNSIFDKDVKFTLVNNNKKIDFLKIRAKYNEFDDTNEKKDIKKSLLDMLQRNIDTIKSNKELYVMFASKKEEEFLSELPFGSIAKW